MSTTGHITRFVTGQRYYCRSLGDHDCIWRFTVTARTAQTVTIQADDETTTTRRRIRVWNGTEAVDPLGRYSLSPVLTATKTEDPQERPAS